MLEDLLNLWPLLVAIAALATTWGVTQFRVNKQSEETKGIIKALGSFKQYSYNKFEGISQHCNVREVTIANTLKDMEIELAKVNTKLDNLQQVVDESNLATLGVHIANLTDTVSEVKAWFQRLEGRINRLETLRSK